MDLIATGLSSAVLNGCHLRLSAVEIVALRGAFGSGKTLLLRAIADLDPHDGEVSLNGVVRSGMSGPEWRRRVRFVAAEAAWWADRLGEQFRAPDKVGAMATQVDFPHGCMDWHVAQLSTEEKQRLAFLRAVEDRQNVLFLHVLFLHGPKSDPPASVRVRRVRFRSDATRAIPRQQVTANIKRSSPVTATKPNPVLRGVEGRLRLFEPPRAIRAQLFFR